MNHHLILVINPGSTSTKIAVFQDSKKIIQQTIRHTTDELAKFKDIINQADFRREVILTKLNEAGIKLHSLSAVVGRGGLLKPIPGGTYAVTLDMLADLRAEDRGSHASNLGAIIANEIAIKQGIPAYIVDPVCVDEMNDIARLSGVIDLPRESLFHALNQKAIARRVADELGMKYQDLRIIVAHLGGGISVGVHDKGMVIDVNNAVAGEGPYSPERSGGIPVGALVNVCYSGRYSHQDVMKMLKGSGGLVSYLGTNDAVEVEKQISEGNDKARLVYEGIAYQVAKEIGSAATVLKGEVDVIAITGGIAHSAMLMEWIKERIQFIAPVRIYPGEDEMEALAAGALRVLLGEEEAKDYSRSFFEADIFNSVK